MTTEPRTTIHLVAHTHWDREWYLPFQVFRLKLVHLMDGLLDLLKADPQFEYFTLDGQTIVLDDYLQIRPERRAEITALVQSGRLLIGPWHVLPDEFLVSPEAIIRNLLQGERTAHEFGGKMKIGYIPDPFGHIGQMPQILNGFGIESACVQRGLSDEPCEFWWEAPDGSRVLMIFLRDGYGSAAGLPVLEPVAFLAEVRRLADSLNPFSCSSQRLLMQGNDHLEPQPVTPAAILAANEVLEGAQIIASTLPHYLDTLRSEISGKPLPTFTGELRSSKRFHLLPGVLSARMWIKQRNHACETLLEKWAEPFSTWAALLDEGRWTKDEGLPKIGKDSSTNNLLSSSVVRRSSFFQNPAQILRHAWRLLMECHPHDSICGCSIDQVHAEMKPRFDQVEQIGEEITRQSLVALAEQMDTLPPHSLAKSGSSTQAFVVFNPHSWNRTDQVEVSTQLPIPKAGFFIRTEQGEVLPHQIGETRVREIAQLTLNKEQLQNLLGSAQGGSITNLPIQEVQFRREGEQLQILIELADSGESNAEVLAQALPTVWQALADPSISGFFVRAEVRSTQIRFLAEGVPGCGYKTFWIQPAEGMSKPPEEAGFLPGVPEHPESVILQESQTPPENHRKIENEFFVIEASSQDGTLTLIDRRNGVIYHGLNHFVDGGDCGDEYNYCPPAVDTLIETTQVLDVQAWSNPLECTLRIALQLEIPLGLSSDRQERCKDMGRMRIDTRITLIRGTPRIDIHTEVENPAGDHRLRVHFPVPFSVPAADYDSPFQILTRPVGIPAYDETWAEHPRPEVPQRSFCSVSNGEIGLMIANRGLPEVEVRHNPAGQAEIALTLLRCVGWLSRDDLSNRKGHAGPGLPAPGAQMAGTWGFDYALIPIPSTDKETGFGFQRACQEAYAFNVPLRGLTTPMHPGSLHSAGSLLQIKPQAFLLSTVKLAEDGSGWIVRGYNTLPDKVRAGIISRVPYETVFRANLAEETLQELNQTPEGEVEFDAGGYEIATLRFTTKSRDILPSIT